MLELHTDRLYLRTLTEADWPLFLRLHREPETMRHVFDELPESEVRRGFEHRLAQWSPEAEHWLCLVMVDKASGCDVGVTGLRVLRPGHAEIGYLLLPHWHGEPRHGGFTRFSGRLLHCNLQTEQVTVLAQGLDTPSNLCLVRDGVLVSEGMGLLGRALPTPEGEVVQLGGRVRWVGL